MTGVGWHEQEMELGSPEERIPVPIVADASIATGKVKEGMFVPVLLIDTSSRPDIENLIRFHMVQPTGECKSVWARLDPDKTNAINLVLRFVSPSECTVVLEFALPEQGGVVDQIVHAEALHLYPARPGERFKDDMEREHILIEVPCKDFAGEWDDILDSTFEEEARRQGLSGKQAQEFAQKIKEEWRKISKGLSPGKR